MPGLLKVDCIGYCNLYLRPYFAQYTHILLDMMKTIPIFFILFNVQVTLERNASYYDANKGLIANGQPYDTVKYPFVVYLLKIYVKNWKKEISLCTGSLITEQFVLTAAHCTNGVTRYDIIVLWRSLYIIIYINCIRWLFESMKWIFTKGSITFTGISPQY